MKPFVTDGCSVISQIYAVLSFGHATLPWRDACVRHDIEYWIGGTTHDRLNADIVLANQIAIMGYKLTATVMYYAVRFGGVPWLPFSWRWGFGHDETSRCNYRERTNKEVQLRLDVISELYNDISN